MKRILYNFRIGLEQWAKKKGQLIFLTLQLMSLFVLVGMMLTIVFNLARYNDLLKKSTGNKESFIFQYDMSKARLDRFTDDKVENKLVDFINFLTQTTIEYMLIDNTEEILVDGSSSELIKGNTNFLQSFDLINITPDIKENFDNLILYKGEESKKIVPVIVGAYYKHKYKIGDLLNNNRGREYKIIGFLSEDKAYIMPKQSKNILPLYKSVIMPAEVDIENNSSMVFLISHCVFKVNNYNELENVEKKIYSFDFLDFFLIDYKNQIEYVRGDLKETITIHAFFAVLLFVFSWISIFTYLIQIINENTYTYAVHMLYGANLVDIVERVIAKLGIVFLLSNIISFIIFKVRVVSIVLLTGSITCFSIVIAYVYFILKSKNIIYTLRKRG